MARKTTDVKTILDFANTQLKRSDAEADASFKAGVCAMITKILHESGNYEGFAFLNKGENKAGTYDWYCREYFASRTLKK